MSLFPKDRKKASVIGIERVRGKVVTDRVRGIIIVGDYLRLITFVPSKIVPSKKQIYWKVLNRVTSSA